MINKSLIPSGYKPSVYIIGSGPFAKELQCYYFSIFNVVPKLIDKDDTERNFIYGDSVYLGSGKPTIKMAMEKQIKISVGESIKLGYFSKFSDHGDGSVFAPGSVISSNVKIGHHVLINYNASIGHDCLIADFVSIGPIAAIGGNVRIDKGAYIGAGALIRENLMIGEGAVVGMGAVVTKDVPAGVTVCGIPAKPVTIVGGWQ